MTNTSADFQNAFQALVRFTTDNPHHESVDYIRIVLQSLAFNRSEVINLSLLATLLSAENMEHVLILLRTRAFQKWPQGHASSDDMMNLYGLAA